MEIAKSLLLSKSTLNHETVDELINLTKVILEQNYFTFDNKYYLQRDGLAMGSPLSGILAEIYLNHIETNEILSTKNKHYKKFLFYRRYVDGSSDSDSDNDSCLLYTSGRTWCHNGVKTETLHIRFYGRPQSFQLALV